MGYTTEFEGEIGIVPPLNPAEVAYLAGFSASRRMHRGNGPYYIGGGHAGQDREDDVLAHGNQPPPEQPGLWCQWVPTADGTALVWDGGEKFYDAEAWMRYLIQTFLMPGATLAAELARPVPGRGYHHHFAAFTFNHVADGRIDAQGEDPDDQWTLVVANNVVFTERGTLAVGA